jgi:hypothetical protein
MITEQEYLEWKTHPVTQAHNQLLQVWREKLRDQMEQGILKTDSAHAYMLMQAEIVGNLGVLRQLMDVDYELLTGELSDE